MARRPNKHDISLALVVTPDSDGNLIGRNDEDDTLIGDANNNILDGFQGADTLTGGTGADTFKVHSWASSNVTYGIDTVTDFNIAEGDKLDFSNITHYSDADMAVAVSRDLLWSDFTYDPITHNLHVEVVAGDPRWDIDMVILGDAPTPESVIL